MTRKSPKESATMFNINFFKKGLDGNLYIISKRSNGVKYWKKSNNEEKKYIKELEKIDKKEIHDPSLHIRENCKYPKQILDLKQSRLRAIEAFNKAKNT